MPVIAPPLAISPEDLRTLGQWSRSGSIRAALAERARILLLAAERTSNTDIATQLGRSLPTVGLYLDPPERAIVVCVDETAQIQARARTAPNLPLGPGSPERRTHDDTRHGTTTLFAALEVATGKVVDQCFQQHRHCEFLAFLK